MKGNGRKGNDKRTPIDHWETLKVLHSDSKPVGRDGDLGVVIEVQRPVFEGGRTGRSTMGVIIRRGERMLRLFCRNGDTHEISALRDMLADLPDTVLDEYASEYDTLRAENDPPPRERGGGGRERGSGPRPGEVGGGLSRFSGESKRDRKRRKRQEREQDHG